MVNQLDLNEMIKEDLVAISITKKHFESDGDAKLRRTKEYVILFFGLGLIASLFLICIYSFINNPANSVAMNVASTISAAFAGYLFRGKS